MESQRRASKFREVGLSAPASATTTKDTARLRPQGVRFRSRDEVHLIDRRDEIGVDATESKTEPRRPQQTNSAAASPPPAKDRSMVYRFGGAFLLLTAVVPFLYTASPFSQASVLPIQPVEGGVIPEDARMRARAVPDLTPRDDSPTDICFRWAQQSAIVNGTLYLYGGQATTEPGQSSNTWNNDFLTMDLTQNWSITSQTLLTGLPQPSGPPAVALGYLWGSYESLFLYGGEFSWKPIVTPSALSTWEYSISSQSWIEHNNPSTSSGKNAPSNDDPVQRAAEGAGVSVPSLGRGFYFGGHLDGYTTPGWASWIPRLYLQSLLEFTFPGYSNSQVDTLHNGKDAGTDGNYRNITDGGLQSSAGFTQRADGLLLYVPGFGDQGILLALAGGTNQTFTQMNNIDVYDIASSSWYKQATSGSTPTIRVNPCAGIAAAPDGSSYNIYMFGGQNLTPYGNQSQFDDMWILTLPSFTWIEVDQSGQSVPPGRSGHTCNVWDGQMVVVGGYVGDQLSCDSPGIYVYDLGKTQWVQQFTALSPGGSATSSSSSSSSSSGSGSGNGSKPGPGSSSFNSTGSNNPLNQQPAQLANASAPGGLEGSYGYTVPEAVIKVIGGSPSGGATVTAPVVTATSGPLATGKPITYTVTGSNGAVTTETSSPNNPSSSSNGSSSNNGKAHSGPNIAAIVVGVICGILVLVVCYLGFCAYIYRRQLHLYKRHVEMSQAQARGEKMPAIPGLLATNSAKNSAGERRDQQPQSSSLRNWNSDGNSQAASSQAQSGISGGAQTSTIAAAAGARPAGYQNVRRDSDGSSTEELFHSLEPTFVGVLLNPRRSLRIVNRD
ncbi:hypothetical protein LTR62_002476 [Meristemomyces frigidus]|uniref:Kelch repeat-containing protein n=1 Tax=Meristemomyces frigidus TaxID=1508187 RepID=A0AAN7TM88_9PEZI|nr:hypothetical protein LTR62_002476 [Meristemomyces frigidus]